MSDGYITHCVECGRELEEFEGDICESCWVLDYEAEDDYDYDNDYEYFGYNYYDGDEYIPTRWQRFKNWLNRGIWAIRDRINPPPDDIPF